jgi:hypothetical protein
MSRVHKMLRVVTLAVMVGAAPVVDDGNPCTADACDPSAGITHTLVAAGTACADGNACNGAETCNAAGICSAGTPPAVDDNNPCTADSCDSTGGVQHTPVASGTSCSDDNVCNGAETCDAAGTCQAGVALNPDDGNSCTTDTCHWTSGVSHTPVATGTACGGDICSGGGTCNGSGACVGSAPVPTDDQNSCTVDFCDPNTGEVTHFPEVAGTACSMDACTSGATCSGAGQCGGGVPLAVDDGIACTLDTCDPITGPAHLPCGPIDRTVATSIHQSLEWLYTGSRPIQTGVAPGTIDPQRAAGVRGTVSDFAGEPVAGVTITVVDHPEFGRTTTRADGAFDMVVNGGGQVTLMLQKDGYLEAQRTRHVPWADWVEVDELVLVKPDPAVTEVHLEEPSEALQVVRGSLEMRCEKRSKK